MHYSLCYTDCYLLNYTDAIGWGVSFCESKFTVIHSFQSNFRSVLKWLRHMKVLSRVLTWIFLSCYIRHSFTIPKGHCPYCTQMALLGIRHRDIVRGHDTYQVGFAFVPASYLSFKLRYSEVPLGATVGRISAAPFPEYSLGWGVFWRGRSSEPRIFDLSFGPLPDKHLLIT